MSNYWAIAIGINQYQHFQPLLYAQWDAQSLWTYWIKEGGIPHTQCLLLTDSASLERASSERVSSMLPTKKTIEQQLVQWGHHRVGPEDTLWCFFSGYGVNYQGRDYLMPLDGDPNNVAQTGIAADAFFSTLNAFPTHRIVLLLDLKRLPDALSANAQVPANRLGDDIANHATQTGIATILASQPDQLSHETLTLRQGLFTATLLEGLRTHGCFQVGQLTQYLETRLPELSEYHWRPRQEPLVVVPDAQQQWVLLDPVSRQPATVGVRSGQAPSLVELGQMDKDESSNPPSSSSPTLTGTSSLPSPPLPSPPLPSIDLSDVELSDQQDSNSEATGIPFTDLSPSEASDASARSPQSSTVKLPVLGTNLSYTPHPPTSSAKTILPPPLNTSSPAPAEILDNDPPETIPVEDNTLAENHTEENDNTFWSKYLPYWLSLLALMILVVLRLNWPALTKHSSLLPTPNAETPSSVPAPDSTNGDSDSVDNSGGDGTGEANENGNEAIASPDASFPLPDSSSETPPETLPENSAGDNADNPEDAVDDTEGSSDSSAEIDTTPGTDADSSPNGDSDVGGNASNSDDNNGNSSGLFPGLFGGNKSDGPAGDALEQAKTAVADGNYEDAAIWLDQVPVEAQTEEYERLRAEVDAVRSQAGQANREILDRALATLNEARLETRVNQASDFGRAIAIASQIQPGQPLYDEAQSYIARWGEVILDLAKSRAQSGEYEKAIATVNLIEEDLPLLYPKAQTLLADWQDVMGVDGSSQAIIDAAKTDITRFSDQAFPYNRGIGKLREIEPDDPLYGEAQGLIDEWSQEILNIATNRAQQGNIQLAIDTAKYVPQDTAAYGDALTAIDQWSQ